MDEPLTTWYCDVCGSQIDGADRGYVIWKVDDEMKDYGFKVIHQTTCDRRDYGASMALADLLGEDGKVILTAMLSYGPLHLSSGRDSGIRVADNDEFIDLFRRMQTPYYEEARRLFQRPEVRDWYYDHNEYAPYLPESLKAMIERHAE